MYHEVRGSNLHDGLEAQPLMEEEVEIPPPAEGVDLDVGDGRSLSRSGSTKKKKGVKR